MSEVPESSDGPNPFSFKTFVKRGGTVDGASFPAAQKQRSTSLRGSASGKKGEGTSKRRKKKTSGGEVEEVPFPDLGAKSDAGKPSDEHRGDNPFSFTKFVKRKESVKQTVSSVLRDDTEEFSTSSSDDSDNDVIVQPPKVSSSKSSPSLNKKTSKPSKGSSSPLLSSVPLTTAPLANTAAPLAKSNTKAKQPQAEKRKSRKLFSDDSDSSSSGEDPLLSGIPKPVSMDTITNPTHMGGATLEDLFEEPLVPGGILLTGKGGESSSDDTLDSPEVAQPVVAVLDGGTRISSVALEQLNKLKAENTRLKEELKQSKEETKQFKEKNASLKQKVKALKKKEAEETQALEEMVLKVESNLQTSTKRAISAESTIVKLKQEISTLQTKLALSTPESVHQHYEEMLMGVREKANYSSQQLVLAAHMADQSIRELAGGVDTLKNIAEILQFIDNICELKDKTS